jgi:hypothetical protein
MAEIGHFIGEISVPDPKVFAVAHAKFKIEWAKNPRCCTGGPALPATL